MGKEQSHVDTAPNASSVISSTAIIKPVTWRDVEGLYNAVFDLVERHNKRAKHTGFQKCGCEDCKPFREIIEKVQT